LPIIDTAGHGKSPGNVKNIISSSVPSKNVTSMHAKGYNP